MKDWVDVTRCFTEEERHYKDLYMEINEVCDDLLEVSLFSSEEDLYEIYFSFEIMYGIIYVEAEEAHSKREEIKKELLTEYLKNKKPSDAFINEFCEKHKVALPNDLFFDASELFR